MAVSNAEKARTKKWQDRINSANKLYDKWSERYQTAKLEDYYLGRQWQGLGITEEDAKKLYVINLVFATIETNKPSMIFQNPQVRFSVKPTHADDLMTNAEERVRLCQDTVQSFIDDPDFGFVEETSLALHEAHFRYGIIEVGYTGDWIDNPEAGKPVLKEKDPDRAGGKEGEEQEEPQAVIDSEGKPVIQPDRIPQSENLFLKRIPASQFRCSISSKNRASQNDWVGYYEWHYVEDIKANPLYKKGAKDLKASGSLNSELRDTPGDDETEADSERRSGMVKVWKIWDIRGKKKKVIADGHERFLQEGENYSFLPLAFLRLYPVLDSFYPCPPVHQWVGPQDEINETRDAQRAHRRRFYRRYTRMQGAIDDVEMEKLETGGDGVCAISNVPNPIQEVPLAPMGGDAWQHLDASRSDFLQISGTGGDQRGIAESETATQASIIDRHNNLREGSARNRVQTWLAEISRLMLLTMRESMALPFWIKKNVDVTAIEANQGSEIMRVAQLWQEIHAEELGTTDVEVQIDLSTMSPISQEQERNSWNQILGLLTNPNLTMVLSMSPVLLKKTLRLYGVTSQTEQMEVAKVMQQIMMMQMAQAQAAAAEKEGAPGSAGPAPGLDDANSVPPGETPAEMQGTVQ